VDLGADYFQRKLGTQKMSMVIHYEWAIFNSYFDITRGYEYKGKNMWSTIGFADLFHQKKVPTM